MTNFTQKNKNKNYNACDAELEVFNFGSFRLRGKWHSLSELAIARPSQYRGVLFSIAIAFFIVFFIANFLNILSGRTSLNNSFGIPAAYAYSRYPGDYLAKTMIRSAGTVNIEAGKAVTFTVGFKNIGKETWYNTGENFMSIGTAEPYYRNSQFEHQFWFRPTMPAKMETDKVEPGQIGYFRFALQAPAIPGFYLEHFRISAENRAWLVGGDIAIPINVTGSASANMVASPSVSSATLISNIPNTSSGYKGTKLLQSEYAVEMPRGSSREFIAGYKNLSDFTWPAGSVVIKASSNRLYDPGWLGSYNITANDMEIRPGSIGFFKFKISPSSYQGDYKETFYLVDPKSNQISGTSFSLPMNITASAYVATSYSSSAAAQQATSINEEPLDDTDDQNISQSIMYNSEPIMRVGLFYTTDTIKVSADKDFDVYEGGNKFMERSAGQSVLSSFDLSAKQFTIDNTLHIGNVPLRFTSDNGAIFTVLNEDNEPLWRSNINSYNEFKGTIEIRYASATGRLWVINELSIEDYLKGMAETSNNSHPEFQKTLIVAARTYAIYHYNRQTKHADENFYVDSQYDQLYRGYGLEKRMSNLVASVDATRGQIVTYDNKVAITPYFSQSDGRTRSWSEVWYGESPAWLVSVPDPYCQGKTLLGHGVGMSAVGALNMAHDNVSYDNILKFYYTGIEVKKVYN